jgi:hypothetical protein
MNLDDLISYENENTSLDFKSVQYKKENYEDLIKDVMSMANADIEVDRFIIIGIKHKPFGEKNVVGIEKTEFVDSATFQQIILENIEPHVNLDYTPYEYDGKLLGIIKISNCNEKPYMMKKDFKKLKKGDTFIRKGTQQCRMERRDYEKIYSLRKPNNDFAEKVKIGFDNNQFCKEINLNANEKFDLPSQLAKRKIEEIIDKKRHELKIQELNPHKQVIKPLDFHLSNLSFGRPLPYEKRTIEELEKNLLNVEEVYKEDDYYEFFEVHSHKINIHILNQGSSYIEDAFIEVTIEKVEGLIISSRIYEKPKDNSILSYSIVNEPIKIDYYPMVEQENSYYKVTQHLGDIKHHLPTTSFVEPLRVVLTEKTKGKKIQLNFKLFGKNLEEPIIEQLNINVESKFENLDN